MGEVPLYLAAIHDWPPKSATHRPSLSNCALGDQIVFFRLLIGTAARRNPVACGTNQGSCKRRFGHPSVGWRSTPAAGGWVVGGGERAVCTVKASRAAHTVGDAVDRPSALGRARPGPPGRLLEEGRCKATWKTEFKLPWHKAGPPNHHDDKVDSDQQVVKKELSLSVSLPHLGALDQARPVSCFRV